MSWTVPVCCVIMDSRTLKVKLNVTLNCIVMKRIKIEKTEHGLKYVRIYAVRKIKKGKSTDLMHFIFREDAEGYKARAVNRYPNDLIYVHEIICWKD